MTLNGWQRLWLVVVTLWTMVIITLTIMFWPKSIYHPPNGFSHEVVREMKVKDWNGKDNCSTAQRGPRKTYRVTASDGQARQIVSDHMPTEGELETLFIEPDISATAVDSVADAIRVAFPQTYDDLTDEELEQAVRSKAPELGRIVRNMIATHESKENIVLVVRHAAESRVKGADQLTPMFARVEVPIKGEKDAGAVLCFSGEPKHRVEQIASDYYDTYSRVLKSKQRKAAAGALGIWLIPSAFVYALGWSVGWIKRGFGRGVTP
jgi:hypothetical protein